MKKSEITKPVSYTHLDVYKRQDLRRENGKRNRIRLANFPSKKYLEDLVVEDLPEDARKKLKLLSSLEFIKTGQNVIPVSYTHLYNHFKYG